MDVSATCLGCGMTVTGCEEPDDITAPLRVAFALCGPAEDTVTISSTVTYDVTLDGTENLVRAAWTSRRLPSPRRAPTPAQCRTRPQAAGAVIPSSPALEDFKVGFKDATATAAGVPAGLVKIKAVKKGSVVVDFEIEVRPRGRPRPTRAPGGLPQPRLCRRGRCAVDNAVSTRI